MNLEEERKKLLQATVDALRAAWPMAEAGRASPSIEARDNPELHEGREAVAPTGRRAARTHHSRNRSSRRD